MATRQGKVIQTQLHPYALVLEWTGLLLNDDGDYLLLPLSADKTLHVYGVFGGATVTLRGSNEDLPPGAPFDLTGPYATPAISFTATGGKQVLENPLRIGVKVTGGDGTTALTVRLVCRGHD